MKAVPYLWNIWNNYFRKLYCRNQCYIGHIDELRYVSTRPINFVPISVTSNTVLVMPETNSTLSEENDLRKSSPTTQQQENDFYKHSIIPSYVRVCSKLVFIIFEIMCTKGTRGRVLINTLDGYLINARSTVGRESTNFRLIHMSGSTLGQLSTDCSSNVSRLSMKMLIKCRLSVDPEYWLGCRLSVNQDFDRVSITGW